MATRTIHDLEAIFLMAKKIVKDIDIDALCEQNRPEIIAKCDNGNCVVFRPPYLFKEDIKDRDYEHTLMKSNFNHMKVIEYTGKIFLKTEKIGFLLPSPLKERGEYCLIAFSANIENKYAMGVTFDKGGENVSFFTEFSISPDSFILCSFLDNLSDEEIKNLKNSQVHY